MVAKVHGGIFKDQVSTGSLRAFVIAATDIASAVATADNQAWTLADGTAAVYNTGDAVPNTLADIVCRVISTRATIVSIEFETGKMHVVLENAAGWSYNKANGSAASLDVELEKLSTAQAAYSKAGVAAGAVAAGGAQFTVTECKMLFDENSTTAALGGNEHDQS